MTNVMHAHGRVYNASYIRILVSNARGMLKSHKRMPFIMLPGLTTLAEWQRVKFSINDAVPGTIAGRKFVN